MLKQKGILFDSTLCVGCGECYNACKQKNSLPQTNSDYLKDHLSSNTFTVIEQYEEIYSRKMCMHCATPTCVSVCPVGALEKTDIGPVIYNENKCIGCRYCMQACPHNIPRYEWNELSPRIKKCSMCYDRISKGEQTACADACPNGATMFGNLDELKIEALKRIKENPSSYFPEVYGLNEAGGTNVLVLSSVPFDRLGFAANLPKEPLSNYTMKALEKIPSVVSIGTIFLGGMYWLTKRKNEIAKENSLKEHGVKNELK